MAILDAWGVKFVATTQPIDTTTPVGRLKLGVLAAKKLREKNKKKRSGKKTRKKRSAVKKGKR